MLKRAGAEFIILGHSDNRSEGETNQLIKKKIKSALNEKLNIIFCIGETFKEKKSGKTFSTLRKQIRNSIEKKFKINKIIFAYEPVWSIGTNKVPKIDELKKHVAQKIGPIARPDEIRCSDALPKTRSGKIMRRILRALAAGEEVQGDTSTLEDRSVLDKLRS